MLTHDRVMSIISEYPVKVYEGTQGRQSILYPGSRFAHKQVIRELIHTGNGYIPKGERYGVTGKRQYRDGAVNIQDFDEAEFRSAVEKVLTYMGWKR